MCGLVFSYRPLRILTTNNTPTYQHTHTHTRYDILSTHPTICACVISLGAAEKLRCAWSENSNQDTHTHTHTPVSFLLPFSACALKGHRREMIPVLSAERCRDRTRPTLSVVTFLAKQSLTNKQIDKQPELVVLFWLFVCPWHLWLCFDSPCVLLTDQCCD